MDLYKFIGFAAASAVLAFSVRQFDPHAGRGIAIASGAFILIGVLARVTGVLDSIEKLAAEGELPLESLFVGIKAVGIAYITELASSVCSDLGETSLASCCALVGRTLLLTLALPVIGNIATVLIDLVRTTI